MRTLSPGMQASLAGGATTLARCWRLTRRDGVVLGFTDHDRALSFDGTVFAAATGLEAADTQAELGFAVGGGDIAGMLTAASLTEDGLAAGLYDAASLEVWLVDWQSPDNRILMETGWLGEVRRAGAAFTAELRSETQRYDEVRGRLFQAACAADFGDARCGLDATRAPWSARATVSGGDGHASIETAGLGGFAGGWFTGGRLAVLTGASAGLVVEVRAHALSGAWAVLDLWQPAASGIAAGDTVSLTAGCDKRYETCSSRFANAVNFRGFPHMPGNDVVLRAAREGEPGMDGGSLFR